MRLRTLTTSGKSLLIATAVAASITLTSLPAAASTAPTTSTPVADATVHTGAPAVVPPRPVDQDAAYFTGIASGMARQAAGKVATTGLTTQIQALSQPQDLSPAVVHMLIGQLRETTSQVAQSLAAFNAEQAARAAAARKAAAHRAAQAARAAAAQAARTAVTVRQQHPTVQRARPQASSPAPASVGMPVTVSGGSPQAIARQMMSSRYGWGADQFQCLNALWNRESGWRVNAANGSGAYGIPQALPGSKMGPGWQTDAAVQISWGLGYISSRYGTPCTAWAHSQSTGWY